MRRWEEFAEEAPALAQAGSALLYQHGPRLAYLASVRRDGAPRLHPVCPVVTHGGLWVFVGNQSPKVGDLRRDGRYALHAFPADERDDEFCCSGLASTVADPALEAAVLEVYLAQGTTTQDHTLVELRLDRALHAAYGPRPSWPPTYTRWRAAA
ncbi:MAG TPA: pyridoxamine 5'-phosphate oxidase family protein [Acidimicrobiales bacterium]